MEKNYLTTDVRSYLRHRLYCYN